MHRARQLAVAALLLASAALLTLGINASSASGVTALSAPTISADIALPGDPVTVSGSGCLATGTVSPSIAIDIVNVSDDPGLDHTQDIASALFAPNPDGTWSRQLTINSTAALGAYDVLVSCINGDQASPYVTDAFTVGTPSSTTTSSAPATESTTTESTTTESTTTGSTTTGSTTTESTTTTSRHKPRTDCPPTPTPSVSTPPSASSAASSAQASASDSATSSEVSAAAVTAAASTPTASSGLAFTGSSDTRFALIGALLLLGGTLATVTGALIHRRRAGAHS